ncbi:UNVERIFIED_CONTAM: SAGA-associated factor 29A [Sesamum calycinum]|uniref:SAGA-associated factor 29A n=1 Tax=Sesamum calycinum TaxID=2727403 RepID=A0AAW2STK5_9LAMI
MSSPDIAGILDNSKELDRLRKEQDEVLFEINKLHKKLQATPEVVEKPGDNSLARLKMLYIQAKELSESEVTVSTQLLGQLDALLPSGTAGQHRRRIEGSEQKKKRMKADSDVSRLSFHAKSSRVSCKFEGEQSLSQKLNTIVMPTFFVLECNMFFTRKFNIVQVAARVTQEDAGKDEWFVVKVIHFDKETREFEVLDEEPGDDEEGSGQRKYKLPMSHIIPFPKRTDLSSVPDFPPGKHVLAVYPETTALYKATVVQARKRKTDDYILEFDDDEEDGSLPQRQEFLTVLIHGVATAID